MAYDTPVNYGNHDLRRDVIRRLMYAGKSVQQIIVALDRRDALDGLVLGEKTQLVRREINTIKQADRAALLRVRKEADEAWSDYVARQQFLYELAVEGRDVVTAQALSKDIARAYGVRTDAPIEVKTDIGELLRQASMSRRQEPKSEQKPGAQQVDERKTIDLLPKDFTFKPLPVEKGS
jgi:hypothetical protein